jgi:hypothetical protein
VNRNHLGARFSAPVQTCPGAHPVFFKIGTGSLFPGDKADAAWRYLSTRNSPRLKKEYNYISTPPLGRNGLLYGEFHPLPSCHFTYSMLTYVVVHMFQALLAIFDGVLSIVIMTFS